MSVTESASRTYYGWQQEKTPFMFGMSTQRVAMLGAGILCLIWPLASSRLQAGVVTWPVSILLIILAFVRLAGRTVDEWAVAFVSFSIIRARGQHKFLSGPFAPTAKTGQAGAAPSMDLPGVLAPLTILEAAVDNGGTMAVVHHRIDRTVTAVARIKFPGLGLVDSARRDQRVGGWGSLLSSLCTEGSPIIRIQTMQRLVPESGAALHRWHADHLNDDAPSAAVEITESLLSTATLATSQREAYLAVTLDTSRAAGAIKGAGGGTAGAATVLVRHLRALTSSIASADLQVEGWLAPRDLAEVLRTAFDPHSSRMLAERRASAIAAATRGLEPGGAPGVSTAHAGPVAAEATRTSYVHDGAVSVTYWVADWPRNKVFSTALAPLLAEGAHRRAFSMHIQPLAPRAAERDVMRERTSRHVAVSMRNKTGQIVPEHEKAALQRAEAQDAERAAGHGLVRYTAYVTVTVTDPSDLEDACAALEADASGAYIDVHRMYWAQDLGFAVSALPVGMGLPKKRW
ncbi:SCO6880 family protein [Streptomyces sp. NPDC008317]|uniref:SCO6880 family protein n=1 Tax=Streptomyces sp. NPDC008317 TaxID=3364827 RepID=UPI0036ECBA1B